MFRKNQDRFAVSNIDQFLRLAHAPPDEALLRRYFAACEREKNELPLSGAERRWVTVNLEANPIWQEKWKALEEELGKPVDWRLHALFPEPAVKSQPFRGPRWLVAPFRLRQPQWTFRHAFATAMALIALYATLWLFGRLTLSENYSLASVTDYREVLRGESRGRHSTAIDEFSAGAAALLAASRDWLGLFPHYDRARVDAAIQHFHRAFQMAEDPFLKAEIAFFLAKAHLMKDEASNAKHWLKQALAQNVADYREEAKLLLEKLQKER